MLRSIILCIGLILTAVGVYIQPLGTLTCSGRPAIDIYTDRSQSQDLYYGTIKDTTGDGLNVQVTPIWMHVVNRGVPITLIIVICAKLFYECVFLWEQMDEYQTLKKWMRRFVQVLALVLFLLLSISLGVINDISNYESVTLAPPTQAKYAPCQDYEITIQAGWGYLLASALLLVLYMGLYFFSYEVPIFGR